VSLNPRGIENKFGPLPWGTVFGSTEVIGAIAKLADELLAPQHRLPTATPSIHLKPIQQQYGLYGSKSVGSAAKEVLKT
jgi:hypothetical protein